MRNAEENDQPPTNVPPPPPPPPPRLQQTSIKQPTNGSSSTTPQSLPLASLPQPPQPERYPMDESPPNPPPQQPTNAPPPTPSPQHPIHAPASPALPTQDPSIDSSSTKHPSNMASSPTYPPSNVLSSLSSEVHPKNSRPSTSKQIPFTPPPPPFPYPPPPLMMPQPPYFQPMMFPPPDYYQYPPFPYFQNPGYMPTMYNEHFQPNIQRSWSTGLFDCFSDPKNSFITLFCPCFTFGQIAEIVNEGQTPWWEGALIYKIIWLSTLSGCTFLYACYYRVKMRKKYMLKGNWFDDFFITCFCHHCALCQGYRQLDHLGFDVALGWQKNKERERRKAMEALYQVPPFVEPGMFR